MSKWTKALKELDSVVDYGYDPFAPENVLQFPSPSLNWIYANKGFGIPKGSGTLLFSQPKAGKSLLIQSLVAQMHQDDPEGIAIIFNTEMRGLFQQGQIFSGLDKDRLIIYDTNDPVQIFDRMERDIVPLLQEGMPLRIVAIDSLNSIAGVKSNTPDRSVADHLIGDHALTIQKGLAKFMPIVRKYKLVAMATAQIRSNVDGGPYGPKEKMAASWAAKHSFEYFVSLRVANAADDKVDIEGNKFEDESVKDLRGNKEQTGHKIVVKMEQSSIGTPGRTGLITLDYKHGIVNQHEEVFLLAYNMGIITREGTSTYCFGDIKARGKGEFARMIKSSPELYYAILDAIKIRDAQR